MFGDFYRKARSVAVNTIQARRNETLKCDDIFSSRALHNIFSLSTDGSLPSFDSFQSILLLNQNL
jgi:hypothetical protein